MRAAQLPPVHVRARGRCPVTDKVELVHHEARRLATRRRRLVGERITEYRCAYCGWWHTGHRGGG